MSARLKTPAVLILLAVALGGCTLEQKLARSFIKMEKPLPFVIMQPSYVFKNNLKTFEIPGYDSLPESLRENLLYENSLFLRFINDSLMIRKFSESFENALRARGLTVYDEVYLDTLLAGSDTAAIINIAQFVLEEYVHPFVGEEEVYDEVIVIDGIDLNAINFNVWFELTMMNGNSRLFLLFQSDYLYDAINGTLKQNLITGEYSFDYTIDTISQGQWYAFAERFGEKAGEQMYDFVLNVFIRDNLPDDYPYEVMYYHYDFDRRLVYPVTEEERIMLMK
jgi:hypothetical protein